MANTTYLATKRSGTRSGVARGRVRLSVTLREDVFEALKARAAEAHHGLSGEAAEAIERDLTRGRKG